METKRPRDCANSPGFRPNLYERLDMNDTTTERWLPVIGYEGFYEVSDMGRARSVTRVIQNGIRRVTRTGKMRRINPGPYRMQLSISRDGIARTVGIHTLVMAAFVGPNPEGMEICHNDGDFRNNRLDNLRYDTHQANMMDSVAHNSHPFARRDRCKKGHIYTPETTCAIKGKPNVRGCRTCQLENRRAYLARRANKIA